MKQTISPVLMGVIIVIVIGVVGFVGYSFLKKGSSGNTPPPEAQKWMDPAHSEMKNHMPPPGAGGRGGPPSGYTGPH